MNVKLTDAQLAKCTIAAIERYMRKLGGDWGGKHYHANLSWQERVAEEAEAIGAEWVVAKYFGLPFSPIESNENYKILADVGNGIEVRWTRWAEGSLIVYEYDRASDIAVLVVGRSPTYHIAGWIPVAMARRDRFRHASQPTWWVSQSDLRPIDTLRSSSYGNAI